MEDLSAWLASKKVFRELDLRKGYYQVPVAQQDVPKTVVITSFGLYKFLRMPFGLRNAGQSFQDFMDKVLEGLDCIFFYLDDILMASKPRRSTRSTWRRSPSGSSSTTWYFTWRSVSSSSRQWSFWGSTCKHKACACWGQVWRPSRPIPSPALSPS